MLSLVARRGAAVQTYVCALLALTCALIASAARAQSTSSCSNIHPSGVNWRTYCQGLSYSGLCGVRTMACVCESEPGVVLLASLIRFRLATAPRLTPPMSSRE